MSRIVHLSDLHFGTEVPAVLAALERAITALAPDLVVISGDLTQRARRREFAAARRFVTALDGEVVVVPGNHDIPLFNPLARALWPFRRYREVFGPTRTMLVEHGRIRLIAVNSVRPERHASGRVGHRRRRRVAELARAAGADDVNIVVAHHPLGTVPLPVPDRKVETQDRHTSEDWWRAGVHLIMSGHVHRPFLMEAHPAPGEIGEDRRGVKEGGGSLWILNAGTAISRRLRHQFPNSFNVVEVPEASGAWTLTIERWDYDIAASRFAPHGRHEACLQRRFTPESGEAKS